MSPSPPLDSPETVETADDGLVFPTENTSNPPQPGPDDAKPDDADGTQASQSPTEIAALVEESAACGERSLLEELDERQDEVLEQLDALNGRIEQLIADWTQQRQEEVDTDGDEPEASTQAPRQPDSQVGKRAA